MTMLLIVGAGASHDVAQSDSVWRVASRYQQGEWPEASPAEFRPPLTPHLFTGPLVDQLLQRYQAASPLVHEARRRVTRDPNAFALEEFLAEFEASSVREDQRALLATRYLLRDYLWACTDYTLSVHGPGMANNYAGLLGRLNRWCRVRNEPLGVVSFNYDLLVDRAFENVMSVRFLKLNAYVATPDRILVKPHGSCNWSRPLFVDGSAGSIYLSRVSSAQGALRSWDWQEQPGDPTVITGVNHGDTVKAEIPALALPVVGKTGPVCPEDHLAALANTLDGPLSIVTVGWRGADQWFLDYLGGVTKAVGIRGLICMGGANQTAKSMAWDLAADMRERLPGFEPILHLGGFNSLQTSNELDAFLGDL